MREKMYIFLILDDNSGRKSADQPSQASQSGSFRARRTRSASRERNLAKIKFCWRCHQTGHESFDCTAELQPANWCPRCLESTHWEDSCWVNEQEVCKQTAARCIQTADFVLILFADFLQYLLSTWSPTLCPSN